MSPQTIGDMTNLWWGIGLVPSTYGGLSCLSSRLSKTLNIADRHLLGNYLASCAD
jgi:hypothetical protein